MTAFGDARAVVQEWRVANEEAGARADHFLVGRIGRLSRNKAKRIILDGDLRKDDEPLKPSRALRPGELVQLWRLPPDDEDALDNAQVKIVHEDADWLVVDKPADLAVHPTARYLHQTLTSWLKRYAPGEPIHPCHRLDRETSGVLVCAKNRRAEAALKTAFQRGEVTKHYLAVVRGHLQEAKLIDAPLALQGDRGLVRIRMVVGGLDALPSQTLVTPVFYDEAQNRTLVNCEPHTGRQHQIRAHLAHIGFPIVGDKLYAMGDEFFDAYTRCALGERIAELEHERQALHASSITFMFEGTQLAFRTDPPEDFARVISYTSKVTF